MFCFRNVVAGLIRLFTTWPSCFSFVISAAHSASPCSSLCSWNLRVLWSCQPPSRSRYTSLSSASYPTSRARPSRSFSLVSFLVCLVCSSLSHHERWLTSDGCSSIFSRSPSGILPFPPMRSGISTISRGAKLVKFREKRRLEITGIRKESSTRLTS